MTAVLRRRHALDDAFDDAARGLEPRDRAFVYRLVVTTLRRLGQLDALLSACLSSPLPARANVTQDILRLGACQLAFLGTPGHAAVDTAVALARQRRQGPYLGLINAVLRRVGREAAGLVANQDAALVNTPPWLAASWQAAYGDDQARAIAAAHLTEPPLDLTLKNDDPELAGRLSARLGAELLPTGSLRLVGAGAVPDLPGFAGGDWWVQDAAAALPARLLGDVRGLTVADLCAAPGGKTAQLAAAGASVIAVDRDETRLSRLNDNLARLRLGAETVVADVLTWRPDRVVDAVLLDAPCSATGTIRRHPDVAWLKRPEDVAALVSQQERLLEAAVACVRPGGLVVYAACSLQPEEGPAHLVRIRETGRVGSVRVAPIALSDADGPLLSAFSDDDGALRTLPCHWPDQGGLDGFYAFRLRVL